MLTTNKTSRARLLTGAGALAVLATAGLGLTASGTAAAAKVRTTVETATGVTLASLDQAAPAAPAAPVAVAPAAPVPDVAPVPAAPGSPHVSRTIVIRDGEPVAIGPGEDAHAKVIGILRRDRDGKALTEGFAHVPDISSMNCKSGGKGGISADKMVLEDKKDGKHRIVICIDRIQKAAAAGAAKAEAMAANSEGMERNAYVHALDGLRSAKARMMTSTDMTAEQRKAALDGIDTAIAEIEGDLAKVK